MVRLPAWKCPLPQGRRPPHEPASNHRQGQVGSSRRTQRLHKALFGAALCRRCKDAGQKQEAKAAGGGDRGLGRVAAGTGESQIPESHGWSADPNHTVLNEDAGVGMGLGMEGGLRVPSKAGSWDQGSGRRGEDRLEIKTWAAPRSRGWDLERPQQSPGTTAQGGSAGASEESLVAAGPWLQGPEPPAQGKRAEGSSLPRDPAWQQRAFPPHIWPVPHAMPKASDPWDWTTCSLRVWAPARGDSLQVSVSTYISVSTGSTGWDSWVMLWECVQLYKNRLLSWWPCHGAAP